MVVMNNKETNIQKNRFKKKPKKILPKFGDFGLVTKNEGRIEFVQLSMVKKIIKLFIKKKKSDIDVIREKIWYFGRPNFYIQKKSKNSRMGKGKGLIERKVIRIRSGFILFEFTGISYIRLMKLCKKLNKFLNVKMTINFKQLSTYPLWSKKIKYMYYHEKYLFQ